MTDATNEQPRWLNPVEATAWRALLTLVRRGFPEIDRQLRTDHDILAVHYHILVTLSAAPECTMRLTDLAAAADVSPSRLSHRLGVLVDRGEVEIADHPDDKRAKQARLTVAGRERLEATAPSHVETVRRVIFDHLSPDQVAAIADALAPVSAALCDHPEYLNPQVARCEE